jgi:hypothetical protein
MIPLAPHSRIDFVPQDVAAACIGDLVRRDVTGGEWWLTGGREAPTVARLVECTEAVAGEYGRRPARPRLMEPEAVDRLIRPLLEETLSTVACRRFDELLETTSLFDGAESFPSSLAALGRPLCASQLEQSWATSVRYWADRKRLAPDRRARAAS